MLHASPSTTSALPSRTGLLVFVQKSKYKSNQGVWLYFYRADSRGMGFQTIKKYFKKYPYCFTVPKLVLKDLSEESYALLCNVHALGAASQPESSIGA